MYVMYVCFSKTAVLKGLFFFQQVDLHCHIWLGGVDQAFARHTSLRTDKSIKNYGFLYYISEACFHLTVPHLCHELLVSNRLIKLYYFKLKGQLYEDEVMNLTEVKC